MITLDTLHILADHCKLMLFIFGRPFNVLCSSSGGFYTIKESNEPSDGHNHHHHHHRYHHRSGRSGTAPTSVLMARSAPSGTVMMYPNPSHTVCSRKGGLGTNGRVPSSITSTGSGSTSAATTASTASTVAVASAAPDISLRQRAVAKLRMFNFHLNWDQLQMTPCKPCG